MTINYALAITTHFEDETHPKRLDIFKKSMESLLSSSFPGKIFLVDDGSTTDTHLKLLEGLNQAGRILIHRRASGGVARAKNTCIRLILESGSDIGFLADDDLFYKDKNWYVPYLEAMEKTGIQHFSYLYEDVPCRIEKFNSVPTRLTPHVNGCFLTFTRALIEQIGYIKILSGKYGHEHSNFSIRAARLTEHKDFFDIVDSKKYIELIPESISIKSIGEINQEEFRKNEIEAIQTTFKYEPLIE